MGPPNLLIVMGRRFFLLIALLVFFQALVSAQSAAAVHRVNMQFTVDQLADLQQNGHYKYSGLVLFYSSSFLVSDQGALRAATEEEITVIDLHQYDGVRRVEERVYVHDAQTDLDLVLLSREEFEQVVLEQLSESDRTDYLNYKAAALRDQEMKQP